MPRGIRFGPMASPTKNEHVFQAPTGTRDFYPSDLNRLRYVQEAWRRTSINHGFDEIDGPTFEHLDLYTVKSGEGIVSELFSFERFGGEKKFALRPEFTPTLARMYASKAGSLPKPTKWFWMENCFRAERPQRGRLREFSQWNCDIIGLPAHDEKDPASVARAKAEVDAECIACAVDCLRRLGLGPNDVKVRFNSRELVSAKLRGMGIDAEREPAVLALIDASAKLSATELKERRTQVGLSQEQFERLMPVPAVAEGAMVLEDSLDEMLGLLTEPMPDELCDWLRYDPSIVRGLAYYTGMVFEVIVDGERAIAGGGRYDRLIEMFGGPPTSAVGFGMGDVVLSLVLQDKGLIPSDERIAHDLGLSPHVYIFAAENKENPEITAAADGAVAHTLASFRSGGLHARRSYKSTRNIGKLLGDATKAGSRFALIVETGTMGQIKDLKSGEQTAVDLREVVAWVRARMGA